tara:strand:- start:545 stop:787 length:243 start_codon:yes stop_codon:yes gene_type:complete
MLFSQDSINDYKEQDLVLVPVYKIRTSPMSTYTSKLASYGIGMVVSLDDNHSVTVITNTGIRKIMLTSICKLDGNEYLLS